MLDEAARRVPSSAAVAPAAPPGEAEEGHEDDGKEGPEASYKKVVQGF